jgi:hypothetical protein
MLPPSQNPSTHDTFIPYTLPVLSATRRKIKMSTYQKMPDLVTSAGG